MFRKLFVLSVILILPGLLQAREIISGQNALHVRELKKGVDSWNRWREANPRVRPDLKGAHLENVNLDGANLKNTTFGGRYQANRNDWRDCKIKNASFKGANLEGATFEGCYIEDSRFDNAKLSDASFDSDGHNYQTRIVNVHFDGARMVRVNLCDVKFGNAWFIGADMRRAQIKRVENYKYNSKLDFTNAVLTFSDFYMSTLKETKFTNAKLILAKFSGVKFEKANFYNANMRSATLTSMEDLGGTRFEKVNLIRANLNGATLRNTRFNRSDLSEASLSPVYCYGRVNFNSSKLFNTNFKNARLQGAWLQFTKIDTANFQSAHLERTSFRHATIYESTFFYAKLQSSDFYKALLMGGDWRGANVQNASFKQATLAGNSKGAGNGTLIKDAMRNTDSADFTGTRYRSRYKKRR